jgi:hypothetical protein
VLWHGGFQLRAWSAGGGLMPSSGTCNRDARVPGRGQTSRAAVSAALSTRNMATRPGAGNRPRQVELTASVLRMCGAVHAFACATKLRPMQPGRTGHAATSPPVPARAGEEQSASRAATVAPGAHPSNCETCESYLIRVQVTVRQSTAATHPDKSRASLVLTVRVPE